MSTLFLYNNYFISAVYFSGNHSVVVTDIIKKIISNKEESFKVVNETFSNDPSPKNKKFLEIVTKNHIVTIDEKTTCYIIYDDIVINKYNNNISEFIKNKQINIFGKGPTFKNIIKNDNMINICINSTINFVDECDIFSFNDLETLNKIKLDKLKNVKYIYIPEYLHFKGKNSFDNHWFIIYKKFKNYFSGKYILFNLYDSPLKNEQIVNIRSGLSTVLTMVEFLSKYYYNYNFTYNYYGIGKKNSNDYHKLFGKNKTPWNNVNIDKVKIKLVNICDKYKLKSKFN